MHCSCSLFFTGTECAGLEPAQEADAHALRAGHLSEEPDRIPQRDPRQRGLHRVGRLRPDAQRDLLGRRQH